MQIQNQKYTIEYDLCIPKKLLDKNKRKYSVDIKKMILSIPFLLGDRSIFNPHSDNYLNEIQNEFIIQFNIEDTYASKINPLYFLQHDNTFTKLFRSYFDILGQHMDKITDTIESCKSKRKWNKVLEYCQTYLAIQESLNQEYDDTIFSTMVEATTYVDIIIEDWDWKLSSVNKLYTLLKHNIPFSFVKLNEEKIDAIKYESDKLISHKLYNCLSHKQKNYFVGIPCYDCAEDSSITACKLLNNNYQNIMNENILINSNVTNTINLLKDVFSNRRVILVCTKSDNINELSEYGIVPTMIHHVQNGDDFMEYDNLKDKWMECKNGDVVLFCCGILGSILSFEWFNSNQTITCLDLDNLYDPILKNKCHMYHQGSNTHCKYCNPTYLKNLPFPTKILKRCDQEYYFFQEWEGFCALYDNDYKRIYRNYQSLYSEVDEEKKLYCVQMMTKCLELLKDDKSFMIGESSLFEEWGEISKTYGEDYKKIYEFYESLYPSMDGDHKYYCRWMMVRCLSFLEGDSEKTQESIQECLKLFPNRAEPIFEILTKVSDPKRITELALRCAKFEEPTSGKWINYDLYRWQALNYILLNAWYADRKDLGKWAYEKLVNERFDHVPDFIQPEILQNGKFY